MELGQTLFTILSGLKDFYEIILKAERLVGRDSLLTKSHSNFFHSFSIGSKIGVAHTRGGPDMNQLFLVIEKEFHIIDESNDERGEFDVNIGVGGRYNLTSRHGLNDRMQAKFCFSDRVGVRKGLNEMRRVVALGGDTIRGVGTGRQLSLSHS